MLHNHLSGNLNPSEQDKDITDNLIQAGRIVSKEVMDHLIISETEYYSFLSSGLLGELRKSKKYVIKYLEEKRIRKEGKEEGLEEGEKKGRKEMAKTMKTEGEPIDKIVKYTQLSIQEIEQL